MAHSLTQPPRPAYQSVDAAPKDSSPPANNLAFSLIDLKRTFQRRADPQLAAARPGFCCLKRGWLSSKGKVWGLYVAPSRLPSTLFRYSTGVNLLFLHPNPSS